MVSVWQFWMYRVSVFAYGAARLKDLVFYTVQSFCFCLWCCSTEGFGFLYWTVAIGELNVTDSVTWCIYSFATSVTDSTCETVLG